MKNLVRYLTHTLPKWNVPILAIVALLGLAMCCSGAMAQSGAGSIQGTITDPTGAVIPGATIHVVNQGTNVASETKSNSVGLYQVPSLFTGDYVVTVTAPGMKTYKAKLTLLVGQNAAINPVMTAGAITQQVEVAADMVQLTTTDNGTIASTLENDRINQLPMNGRTVVSLAGMATPGLEGSGTRANGLMAEAMEYVADGVTTTNRNFGGENQSQAQLPDPDAVQELRVETTNTSAQYATPAAGIMTTKSGTNKLHGTAFETARNNAVGIAKNRNNAYNYVAPHLVRNEFGASAGGPIILPHIYHGKDKSFWFFAYERYSLAQIITQLNPVFTTAMKGGDFSGMVNSSGQLQQLYDPATTAPSTNCNGTGVTNNYCRAPFAGNKIPIGRISPSAKTLFDIAPIPTTADNPLVTSNIIAPNPTFSVIPTITFRVDHSFNETNKTYVRYTSNGEKASNLRNNPTQPATIAADGFPERASGMSFTVDRAYAGAIGYTHVFSPTFFSETIASQQWFSQKQLGADASQANINFEAKLGLPNNFGEPGFPDINPSGIENYFGSQWNYYESQIISNLDENLSKTVGKHQMQFGGRYRHERFGYLPDRSHDVVNFGAYSTALENPTSGANYTGTPNTGLADADMFLGAANYYQLQLNPPYLHFHDMEFDAYFQDNYHVTRNLTANIGLRWEAHPAPWMKYGLAGGFDLKNDAMIFQQPMSYYIAQGFTTQAIVTNMQNLGTSFETPAQAGYPSTMIKNYNMTLGPRLGFAYTPFNGKRGTVIRGAYGRYIYPIPVRSSMMLTANHVPFAANYTQSYTAANQSPDGLPNYQLRAPQTVIMGVNSANVVNTGSINSILPGQAITSLAPNYAPDFVTQTNFTIEQPLKGNSALRLTWLWAHGTNLDHYYYYNAAPSSYVWQMQNGIVAPTGALAGVATNPYDRTVWGNNAYDVKNGWSNDNSLQVNYQRLFHHGIAYQISYVWSKPFRVGGNWSRDATVTTAADYVGTSGTIGTMSSPYGTVIAPALPPARPAGIAPYAEWHALDKYEQYTVDTGIPKNRIRFNGIVDLPFGRGKKFLGGSNRFVDEIVGGYQIAGNGQVGSQDFAVTASNWGPTNPLKVYKHNAPITDCRSGVCHKSYEWFNGYIAPTSLPSGNSNASCKLAAGLVTGMPSGWAPYQTPIDTDCNPADVAAFKYYNTNEVSVLLSNGTASPQGYSPGPQGANPYSHTVLNGPFNYSADLSLFKVFPITERVNLRVNIDAFNALNVQGYNNPNGTDGTEAVEPNGVSNSYNTPRQVQFTMRLTF